MGGQSSIRYENIFILETEVTNNLYFNIESRIEKMNKVPPNLKKVDRELTINVKYNFI